MNDQTELGRAAIKAAENLRLARQAIEQEGNAVGLSQKTFSGYDAEQGLAILADHRGGIAPIKNQGSLSTGAIAQGDEVRSDWESSDWELAAKSEVEGISGSAPGDGATGDDGDGDGDGGDGGGDDSGGEYCSEQILWYRGAIVASDTTITHAAESGPIDYQFPGQIAWVERSGSLTFNVTDLVNFPFTTCPTPNILGNSIYRDYDPGFYDDNAGSCDYTVYYKENLTDGWRGVRSANPPIRTAFGDIPPSSTGADPNGVILIVYDQATTVSSPLARIILPCAPDYEIRCSEDGPPER